MKVCVIGLGYVGSVAAAGLAVSKHDVTAVDIDRALFDKNDPFVPRSVEQFTEFLRELGHTADADALRTEFLQPDAVINN